MNIVLAFLNYFFVLNILKFQLLYRILKIISHALNHNFHKLDLSLFFLLWKILISIKMILTLFLFSLVRKIFIFVSSLFLLFFFFRKILIPFAYLFLKLFFVFLIKLINHFYICIQKIGIRNFYFLCQDFFHQNFSHQSFLHQNFLSQEWKFLYCQKYRESLYRNFLQVFLNVKHLRIIIFACSENRIDENYW